MSRFSPPRSTIVDRFDRAADFASEQTSVSSDFVTAAWLMPVTSMNTRVVPCLSFVSSLLMIGGIERTWFFAVDQHRVALVVGQQLGVGDAFRMRLQNLPAGHFLARHAERHERLFVGIDRAIGDSAA